MKISMAKPKAEPVFFTSNDNISDIYTYKKAYENHVRKLSEIRNKRKDSLKATAQRNLQIEQIKDNKHNNFIFKLNQQASKICDENLKIYEKICRQKSGSRGNNHEQNTIQPRRSIDFTYYSGKKVDSKSIQIKRQNKRFRERIKSTQSCIKNDKLFNEEKKRLQIKSRIRKFNQKSQLKSERYFSAMSTRNRSQSKQKTLSCNLSRQQTNKLNANQEIAKNDAILEKDKPYIYSKRKTISFYHAKDIIKNKIQNYAMPKRVINKEMPFLSSQKRKKKYTHREKDDSFFPTATH